MLPSSTPPPPPPLPPPLSHKFQPHPPIKASEESIGIKSASPHDVCTARKEHLTQISKLYNQRLLLSDHENSSAVFSCYRSINPIKQNGPVCGLVALAMASQLTETKEVLADEILQEAQRCGFSKQGEMFSASHLAELASRFLSCEVKVLHTSDANCEGSGSETIIKHLLHRNTILVPYDADKNHSPCEKNGYKAHWAVITGFAIVFPPHIKVPEWVTSECEQDEDVGSVYHLPESDASNFRERLFEFLPEQCNSFDNSNNFCEEVPCSTEFMEQEPSLICQTNIPDCDSVISASANVEEKSVSTCTISSNIFNKSEKTDKLNNTDGEFSKSCSIYVLAHQGKSNHVGLWSLTDLLSSNSQLNEAGPERDGKSYVLPPGGVSEGLKSQVVVLVENKEIL